MEMKGRRPDRALVGKNIYEEFLLQTRLGCGSCTRRGFWFGGILRLKFWAIKLVENRSTKAKNKPAPEAARACEM